MPEMTEKIRNSLYEIADDQYREFHLKLTPGENKCIGIRLPVLRKIARNISADDWKKYLDECAGRDGNDCLHEELMLQGFVLGYAVMDDEVRKKYLSDFVPKIRSWAICDSCVNGFKFMRKNREYWLRYLEKFSLSKNEFDVRFMIISLMCHFMDEQYIDTVLLYCNTVERSGYYAAMGVAWTVAECYIKYPDKTRLYLKSNSLDIFTHNKAIQKIRESNRVSSDEKEQLNMLKR